MSVTVTAGGASVVGVEVRASLAGSVRQAVTDEQGVATFYLEDATWVVSIAPTGLYAFAGAALAVSGATSVTYAMSALSVGGSVPGRRTGWLAVYGADQLAEAGVPASLVMITPGVHGLFDGSEYAVVSDDSGLAVWTNLFVGAEYEVRRGPEALQGVRFGVEAGDGAFEIGVGLVD